VNVLMPNTHDVLADLVGNIRGKPGWLFRLRLESGDVYPKLVITVPGYDSAQARSTDDLIECALEIEEEGGLTSDLHRRINIAAKKHREFSVSHFFPVPEATYGHNAWRRWIFECCRGVENHELGEWFRDGSERPFSPLHGPGELPYVVHEFRPSVDALTTQDGSIRKPYGED
jgi:hypothetical protein